MNLYLDEKQEFSADHLERIEKNFKLIDSDYDGFLTHSEARTLHRAFGQNPTEEELDGMLADMPKRIDLTMFLDFFKKNYRDPTSEDVLIQAFQVFDVADKGTLNLEKFKEVIRTLGEPISDKDLNDILHEAKITGTEFDYAAFAKILTEGPKGLKH
eukprot:GEMP01086270.1.p1 GENE.GEMP01086270.1~~GEMP01086270.1.p1  ORF type:complete len:157 (+),score=31.83 GEMP01086270.1:91-561(+)